MPKITERRGQELLPLCIREFRFQIPVRIQVIPTYAYIRFLISKNSTRPLPQPSQFAIHIHSVV
jgi:hypothetical protein